MTTERVRARRVVSASSTPLASIFGSGFLIIVPVLERVLGPLAVVGAAAVCALAWVTGTAIRHNVCTVEPLEDAGTLDATSRRLEVVADAVIVVAYVISVALYLRIMAQYVVGEFASGGSPLAERALACAAVVVIVAVGATRGFRGLDLVERVSLVVVLVIVAVLGAVLLVHDVGDLAGGSLRLPPVPHASWTHVLRVLGGIVITVQGFETVRYLGEEYGASTRMRSSRVAQGVATGVYVAFVLLATPLMGLGTPAGPDDTLLQITDRALPLLAVPLVVTAVLSQFSAATADTVAAEGNLGGLIERLGGRPAYLLSGVAAVALAATVGTFAIVAIASRAFAAYYAIQAVVAMRTSEGRARRVGYGALAGVMLAVTLLAEPAG